MGVPHLGLTGMDDVTNYESYLVVIACIDWREFTQLLLEFECGRGDCMYKPVDGAAPYILRVGKANC